MDFIDRLLLENRAWAQENRAYDPELFERLSAGQSPRVLWIGCADSRVPAEQICNAEPGELFVHRNIANVVAEGDSSRSVLEYAIEVLQVEHIVVCGHHRCGGIQAALSPEETGLPHVDRHLEPIRQLRDAHVDTLHPLAERDRVTTLSELNVRAQIELLARLPLIKKAHEEKRGPTLHGMMYALESGQLRELVRWPPGSTHSFMTSSAMALSE
ncbi:carbonic anhydrase [Halotalea alkalilenta]|uniref:carbonic anhydrase n=1 Tax=Halotalea alkalilenta TaxID=376489 RepID=UPI0007D0810B|nr:carbonic anhydrase [Halotalea alkalilenta]